MLQNEQKSRGESGVWEMKKASEIKAWEFPRGHMKRWREGIAFTTDDAAVLHEILKKIVEQ